MSHEWILDVLADLKTFATDNELPALAGQLDELANVAKLELGAPLQPSGNAAKVLNDGGILRHLPPNHFNSLRSDRPSDGGQNSGG